MPPLWECEVDEGGDGGSEQQEEAEGPVEEDHSVDEDAPPTAGTKRCGV